MGKPQGRPNEYLAVLKRRKLSLAAPFFVIVLVAAVVALTLPPVFRSVSTILIEKQEIPADFAMNSASSYAEQRLQLIHQRIISTNRLLEIIKQENLYTDMMGKATMDDIVARMRDDISLEYISTEIVDRRTGQQATATIAFTLAYEGKARPEKVQKVANILAALFLEENLQVRERQALEATSFLEEEQLKTRQMLEESGRTIAAFKREHINELPEVLSVNLQSRHASELAMEKLSDELRTLKEREKSLGRELTTLSPRLVMDETKRIEALQAELTSLESRYSGEYPDVVKIRQEIERIRQSREGGGTGNVAAAPDNPAYINLSHQLTAVRAEMKSAGRQLAELRGKIARMNEWIEATPYVEERYNELLAERRILQTKFDDLSRKLMEANVAYGLEKEQKGERFTLIDPARLPEKPFKPNRMAIFLVGVFLGIGAGVACAVGMEFSDLSVRRAEVLERETSFPVLAVIPVIVTDEDLRQRANRRLVSLVALLLVAAAAVAAFHFLVMDLTGVWEKLLRTIM